MKIKYFSTITFALAFLSVCSFFLGFYFDENSAGAGSFDGDFKNTWKNINTFLNNSVYEGILLTASGDPSVYKSSRTPLIYILNSLLNPFATEKLSFINSIFVLSLSIPIFFYILLKINLVEINKNLIFLITSLVFLSPYFRTSSYWAGEENYGLITTILSLIFLKLIFYSEQIKKNKKIPYYFLLIFFSSTCVYFDQKLLIIPIICFINILLQEKSMNFKIFSFLFYLFLSLPFIYLIFLWKNIIPNVDVDTRYVGSSFNWIHPGYVISILSFYIFPLIFFKKRNILVIIKDLFESKLNKYLSLFFVIYLVYLFFLNDYSFSHYNTGRGITYKVASLLFENLIVQEIFTYFIFLVCFFILLIFFDENKKGLLIISFFVISSILITPIYHEYYDPILLILVFSLFNKNFEINNVSILSLYFYNLMILISANVYYKSLIT